jgi:hypothetical protein
MAADMGGPLTRVKASSSGRGQDDGHRFGSEIGSPAMNGHFRPDLSPDSSYPSCPHCLRFRHATIFGALGALSPGERMGFLNEHKPIRLLRQMQVRCGEQALGPEPQGATIHFSVRAK